LPDIRAARTLRFKRWTSARQWEAHGMAHAIGLRATSFAASATLLGLAVLAALTMTIVQRSASAPEERPWVTIEPEPAPPEPPRVRAPEPPAPAIDGEAIAPMDLTLPEAPILVADFGPPTSYSVPTIVNPQWVRQPRDLARYYPERALRREVEGRVVLDCSVSVRGVLDCAVVSETPANWGFGEAALRISGDYQMVPATRGGVPVEARHRMVVPFEIR
jgi:TonB family protein